MVVVLVVVVAVVVVVMMVLVVVMLIMIIIRIIQISIKSALQLSPSFSGARDGAGSKFVFIPLETQEQHQPSHPSSHPSLLPPCAAAVSAEHALPSVAMTLQQLIAQGTSAFPQVQI